MTTETIDPATAAAELRKKAEMCREDAATSEVHFNAFRTPVLHGAAVAQLVEIDINRQEASDYDRIASILEEAAKTNEANAVRIIRMSEGFDRIRAERDAAWKTANTAEKARDDYRGALNTIAENTTDPWASTVAKVVLGMETTS